MAGLNEKIIGGFQVLREIQSGSGAQGTVYRAVCVDPKNALVPVGTVVALKVMAVQDEDRRQWRKLAKRTAELVRLNHPNVVKYYGCFSESGLFNDIHVVVQECLQGETLKERLRRFPSGLDVDEALKVADAALAGLAYTSVFGIVHRDIKPGNIFLCGDGSVKLIDFEIARQGNGTTTSSAGNIRGSFDYMAPDFTDADFHGDMQSDVFSMGVVLHEMLTGKTPYQRLEGDEKQANFAFLSRWAHSLADGSNPIHVSSRINRLLAHTEEVLSRSLAPRRENRYADFAAFREGLKAIRFRNLRNGQNVYQMLQFIGKGGFGEVFKARLRHTGQLVAVKHLMKANYAERFYREAKIMKKLHDSCFVQFVDFFMMDVGNNREAFLVMAFLDDMPGSSLRDAIKNAGVEGLPKADVFCAFERYARGLQAMHAAGIFHRDIKPSNLYFPAGRPAAAAIMDLGIARDVNGTATHGQVPGTLDYMPPEVVITDNRGDEGMDIYALGLCFYEALTAQTAFPRLPTGAAAYAVFFERAKSKTRPLLDDPEVQRDPELVALLTDMTNPELSLRIRDAGKLLARIRGLRLKRFPDSLGSDDSALADQEQTTQSDFQSETVDETVALGGMTQGTVATQWGGAELEALECERKIVQSRHREIRALMMRRIATCVAVLLILLFVVAGSSFALKPVRNHYAAKKLNEVLNAYRHGNGQLALQMESAWRVQWGPGSHGWLKLDDKTFSSFRAKLDAEKKKIEVARRDKDEKERFDLLRREALSRVESCVSADGKLDEVTYRQMDGWMLPETLANDPEIRRCMSAMRECVSAAITEKLSVEPPLTRRARISEATRLLANPWTARILTQNERNKLAKAIEDASSWCVGVVKNNCATEIQLDGRAIPAGGSCVAVYKDGHSENGVITRKGFKSAHLPPRLDGLTHEVNEGAFSASPVDIEFPRLEVGVRCCFNGKEMSAGEVVSLEPGNYLCTYRKGDDYEEQTVGFSVQVNVPTVIPGPKAWVHTKKFVAEEKERLERERVLRETPVYIEISDFGPEVTLALDGRERSAGRVRMKPGKYGFRYAKQDCVAQEGVLTVMPGVPARLPQPAKWKMTDEAIKRDREARMKDARDKIVSECKSLMENEPIETRQERLSRALEILKGAVVTHRVFSEAEVASAEIEIKRRQRWAVGKVQNKCHGHAIRVGGCLVEVGETKLLVFENGLPVDWCCKVPGYEAKELSHDFDGHVIAIGENDLVAEDVLVSLPRIDAGTTCHFEGTLISKPLSLKPGSYSCVYRKVGYEDQVLQFDVPFGKPCTLPAPGEWKTLPVKVSMPELSGDVTCLVDGADIRTSQMMLPGDHVCEYRRPDFKAQKKRFVVSVATPMALPSIDDWEPTPGLAHLNSAEQHVQQKEWLEAEEALAEAEVISDGNKKRKASLLERVRKQVELQHKVMEAIQCYDDGKIFYGEAVKHYSEACALGYSMTAEDMRRVEHAYESRKKELEEMFAWTMRELRRKRTIDRSIPELENAQKELVEWYRVIKNSAKAIK